jgi:hypothetical protein
MFLQEFRLVITYKKSSTNKLTYILSRPPTNNIIDFETLIHMDPFTHDEYKEAYIEYENFKEVF